MQYINVSQFYESILCFSIPLLIIQRMIIFCCNLSSKYEDYHFQFYEDQFKFTKQYEYSVSKQDGKKKLEQLGDSNKDTMLDKRQHQISVINSVFNEQIHVDQHQKQGSQMERSRTESFGKQMETSSYDPHQNKDTSKINDQQIKQEEFKRKNKIQIDLETDKQLKNTNVAVKNNDNQIKAKQQNNINQQKINEQSGGNEPVMAKKQTSGKQEISQSQNQSVVNEIHEGKDKKVQESQIQQSRMSKFSQFDSLQVRRETLLDDQIQKDMHRNRNNTHQKKQIIELGEGPLMQKAQQQRDKLKYCRRIDDAFNDYIPIIMSVVVLGIISQSVYIYSMCCFFGYAFTSLLFNYANLLQKIEGAQTQTFFGRANQLISSLFIIGLFISYWISTQFY